MGGEKNPLRNMKGRSWCELLMQRCVVVALFPPKLPTECGKYTWLYDVGKSLQERRPASKSWIWILLLRKTNSGECPP